MKISKLFHWLYGFLMLLPVFAVMITCGYVVFNKNAYESYYGETINQTTTNQLNNINDFVVNKNYQFQNELIPLVYTNGSFNIVFDNFKSDVLTYSTTPQKASLYSYGGDNPSIMYIVFRTLDNSYVGEKQLNNSIISFSFTLLSYETNTTSYIPFISSIFSIEYNQYSYLDNVFFYSMDKVFDSPVFSWSKTSFLSQPITYVSGLFGMESTNVVNYYLSYWLAISIIYLVFDLVMYVPLLVHRWIDKGMIE